MAKVTFIMGEPQPKKHSTRFDIESIEDANGMTGDDQKKFKPSFYVPNPLGRNAKRIRVTIEEIE